jgi:O-antigen ligase
VRAELLEESRAGLDNATSGRASLIGNGIRIARDNPISGVGVGSFKREYADRTGLRGREPRKAASHSTPVTVAAETGLPGLALLGWLGVVALGGTLLGRHTGVAGRAALAVGLTLGAIGVHSLFYNALFEDPMTWALLGLAALTTAQRREEEPA